MSDIWTKALRGGPAQTTPRSKGYSNNRYGSKAATDDEVADSADSAQRRTPRQAGMYDRPWKDLSSLATGSRSGTPRSRTYARPPLPRQNSTADDNDAASVAESDDVSIATEDDFREGMQEGESVQVFVRVRPINNAEANEGDHYNCTRIYGDRTVSVDLKHRPEPYQFKFDCVLPEGTSQQEIFDRAGKPIVDNCMAGYNSTIFAYGQTGAGKTYTMQGPLAAALQEGNEERGLAPRVFEYLFSEIDKAQDEQCHGNLTFTCRCSMLEIYNEVITDLLNPTATNLQIREDIKRGCYVEDLSEQLVQNVSDAMRLMRMGAENRHVGETRLNRESSRSHSVFTCTLERHSKSEETGVTNVLFSRLNLIDLAGSERIHGGDHGGSQATGKHFKEACHINKSLTTLGRVIMELVEAQRMSAAGRPQSASGFTGRPGSAFKPRHVPYRDSRLTFLLQDSLGGNAKTLMIANISPSSVSAQETLSTLHFMSRAKCIRNRATINLDARGDVILLQQEIVRLNTELDNLRKGYTEPAIQENKELRHRIEEMSAAKGQMEALLLGLEKENQNLKAERRRLDHKMSQIQKGAGQLDQAIFSLTAKVMHHESLAAAATEKSLAAAQAEHELQVLQLQHELEQERAARMEVELKLQEEVRDNVVAAADKVHSLQKDLENVHTIVEDLRAENDQLREQLAASERKQQQEVAQAVTSSSVLQQQLDNALEAAEALRLEVAALSESKTGMEQQIQDETGRFAALEAELQQKARELTEQLQTQTAECADLQQQLFEAADQASTLRSQLQDTTDREQTLQVEVKAAEEKVADLQKQLETVTECYEEAQEALQVSKSVNKDLNEQLQQLMEQLSQAETKAAEKDQELQAVSSSLSDVQQNHDVVAADLANAQQQLEAGNQQRQALEEELSSLQAKASALEQQIQELEARNSDASCSQDQLQQQLAAVTAEAAATKGADQAAIKELQQKLEQQQQEVTASRSQIAALEAAVSELNSTLKDKAQMLEAAEEQCRGLQQQLESATASATAKTDQLSSDLAAARESSKSRQEELMKQVTEVHLQLSAAQQEQERLQDELDSARSDASLLQAQVADLQAQLSDVRGQASNKAMDCDLLRKKLAAGESTVASLQSEVLERKQETDELRKKLKNAETTAQEQQQTAAEELHSVQRELLDAKELLTSQSFEAQQMQRRLEEMVQRLSDRNAALDAHKEEVKSLKSTIAKMETASRQRDAVLADRTALADQLQADVEAAHTRISQLQQDLAHKESQLRNKLNANELQLKEQIVYNARNRQAMNEIRKVINWAQQAPTPVISTASSVTSPERPASSYKKHRQQIPYASGEQHLMVDGGETEFHSSGGSRLRDSGSGGGQLPAGLPGPPECLPFVLEQSEGGAATGSTSLLGGNRGSEHDTEGSSRPSTSGDAMVSITVGSSGKAKARSNGTGQYGRACLPGLDDTMADVELHDGSIEYQYGLYNEDSKGDLDCARQLLVPEQASSPVRMSNEDGVHHMTSPKQRGIGGSSRNSRRGARDASRKGGLRAGSEHFNFGAMKRNSVLRGSGDSNLVMSVSGEWAAGAHETQQPDMKLPSNIVGDCDVYEQDA